MKINDLLNPQTIGNSKATSKKSSGGADFQKVLEESQKSLSNPATASVNAGGVSLSSPVSLRL